MTKKNKKKIKKLKRKLKNRVSLNQILPDFNTFSAKQKKLSNINLENGTFLVILNKIHHFCFFLLFGLTPLFFTFKNEELFEFNKMILVYFLTLSIIAIWLAKIIITKTILWKKTIFDWPIKIFLLSQILSTIFSLHPRTSLFGYYTRFNGGLFSILTYILLFYALVNNFTKKDLPKIILTNFFSAFCVSIYAILEHFGYSISCLLSSGQFDTNCWVQDVKTRVFASFGQPNWLAAYLIIILPMGLIISTNEKNDEWPKLQSKHLIFIKITNFLMFLGLMFTKSRSGILAFIISSIFLFFVLIIKKKTSKIKKLLNVYALFACLAFFFNFQFLSKFLPLNQTINLNKKESNLTSINQIEINSNPELADNFNKNNQTIDPAKTTITLNQLLAQHQFDDPTLFYPPASTTPTDSMEIRKIVWLGALKIFQRYPFLGSGVETFAYSYYRDRLIEHNLNSEWDFLYNKAHNEFLNFLATTGIFGLASYLVLSLSIFYLFFKPLLMQSKTTTKQINIDLNDELRQDSIFNPEFSLFTLSLLTGLLAMHSANFFGFSIVMTNVLFITFLAFFSILSHQNQLNKIENSEKKNISNNDFIQKILQPTKFWLFILMLFYGLLFNQIAQIWLADYSYSQAKKFLKEGAVTQGIENLQQAINFSPHEALFYDELANVLGQIAIFSAKQKETNQENTNYYLAMSIQASNQALALNPIHINFYKTRSRLLMNLSIIDAQLIDEAIKTLQTAIPLSPTEAKLKYYLGLAFWKKNDLENAKTSFLQAIKEKNNYIEPRKNLALIYEEQKNYQQALAQYLYLDQYLLKYNPEIKDKIASWSAKLNF